MRLGAVRCITRTGLPPTGSRQQVRFFTVAASPEAPAPVIGSEYSFFKVTEGMYTICFLEVILISLNSP